MLKMNTRLKTRWTHANEMYINIGLRTGEDADRTTWEKRIMSYQRSRMTKAREDDDGYKVI